MYDTILFYCVTKLIAQNYKNNKAADFVLLLYNRGTIFVNKQFY